MCNNCQFNWKKRDNFCVDCGNKNPQEEQEGYDMILRRQTHKNCDKCNGVAERYANKFCHRCGKKYLVIWM